MKLPDCKSKTPHVDFVNSFRSFLKMAYKMSERAEDEKDFRLKEEWTMAANEAYHWFAEFKYRFKKQIAREKKAKKLG